MPRKVVISPAVSKAIGQCGLTRSVIVRLLSRLHTDFSSHAREFNAYRYSKDERLFLYQTNLTDGNTQHAFVFLVDDATSPDHLIIADVKHTRRSL